jgi:hypothetical protein
VRCEVAPHRAQLQQAGAAFTLRLHLQVNVDVYWRAAGERQAPLPGAACFTAESLAAWRELNTAADFTEVSAELHNLVASLPLLLHHKVSQEAPALCGFRRLVTPLYD